MYMWASFYFLKECTSRCNLNVNRPKLLYVELSDQCNISKEVYNCCWICYTLLQTKLI